MIKVYEMRGLVECNKVFRVGKLAFRCLFSGGSVNERGLVPAIYSTNDPVKQAVIENSALFKDGTIQIQETIEEESDFLISDEETDTGKETDIDKETEKRGSDFPEVTNSQAAKAILMAEPYNVPLVELGNKEAVKAKASELGITFSNWN